MEGVPKGAPVRVEAKEVVRWLLLIAWRYKLSQADKAEKVLKAFILRDL